MFGLTKQKQSRQLPRKLFWTNRLLETSIIGAFLVSPAAAQFAPPPKPIISPAAAPISEEAEVIETLRLAYRYGFPLVATDRMMKVAYGEVHDAFYLNPGGANAKDQAIPGFNNETMYAGAWFDLINGPLVLNVPPMGDRFFSMPVCDGWNNVVRVIGTRTVGNEGGKYLLVGPGWKGSVPKGLELIRMPTNIGMLATRIMVKDNEDRLKNGWPIMDRLSLTKLSNWPNGPANPNADERVKRLDVGPQTTYTTLVKKMAATEYFNRLNQLMVNNPGYAYDKAVLAKFAKLGIGPGLKFDITKFSPRVRMLIEDYARNSIPREQMKVATVGLEPWMRKYTNRFGSDYDLRYYISVMGLGSQLTEDGIYVFMTSDTNGLSLDGHNKYLIHLEREQVPKVGWSWSFTTYDRMFNLVPNLPLNRHVLTVRSPLQYNTDGSLDIYVQPESPGPEKESNWLPVPKENFFVIMRLYWADKTVVDGLWADPVLKKVD
jgi:DNA sulfur modification protein DndE